MRLKKEPAIRLNFRQLELKAKGLLTTFGSGGHLSLLRDAVVDVDVTREYQPGDRKLDGRASMRAGRVMSRVFTPEKTLTVSILLDLSPSQESKLEASLLAALYLAYLADQGGDNVGLIAFSDRVHYEVAAGPDPRPVIDYLSRVRGAVPGRTDLGAALDRLQAPANSLIVILSDFCYDLTDRMVASCRRLAGSPNTGLTAVVMRNEGDYDFGRFPFRVDLVDAESGGQVNWSLADRPDLATWDRALAGVLRRGRACPVFLRADAADCLMPLTKHLLRG